MEKGQQGPLINPLPNGSIHSNDLPPVRLMPDALLAQLPPAARAAYQEALRLRLPHSSPTDAGGNGPARIPNPPRKAEGLDPNVPLRPPEFAYDSGAPRGPNTAKSSPTSPRMQQTARGSPTIGLYKQGSEGESNGPVWGNRQTTAPVGSASRSGEQTMAATGHMVTGLHMGPQSGARVANHQTKGSWTVQARPAGQGPTYLSGLQQRGPTRFEPRNGGTANDAGQIPPHTAPGTS
jgi:hypothetical protein